MNKRHVVGRKIVDVIQEVCTSTSGRRVHSIERIVFDNGDTLLLSVAELSCDYAIEGRVIKSHAAIAKARGE